MLHWLYWLYWLFLNAGPVAILNWDFRLSAAGLRPSGPNNFARRRLLDAQAGVQPSPFLRRFPPWLPLPTPPPPKPPRNRQNVPDDGRVPLLHHSLVMNAARNQFSLTRVASKPAARRKSKFLSVGLRSPVPLFGYEPSGFRPSDFGFQVPGGSPMASSRRSL